MLQPKDDLRRRPGISAPRSDRVARWSSSSQVEVVALEIECGHGLIGDLDPLGMGIGVAFAADGQPGLCARSLCPVFVVVWAMGSTTAMRLMRGVARQFWVMWRNMRGSIVFHFEVPGG